MIDLYWATPQSPSDDNTNTGGKYFYYKNMKIFYKIILDELKSNLKSAYKELEKTPKSSVSLLIDEKQLFFMYFYSFY
jgi:hypothetical protein